MGKTQPPVGALRIQIWGPCRTSLPGGSKSQSHHPHPREVRLLSPASSPPPARKESQGSLREGVSPPQWGRWLRG